MPYVRSVIGVVGGLLLISLIVEPLEFGLVALVNGEVTTEPELYYGIRNRGWFLVLKLFYNTGAAGIVVGASWAERRSGMTRRSGHAVAGEA